MNYIGNAFSLQMVPLPASIEVEEVSFDEIPLDCVSCVGHVDTANVVSTILGRAVPANRINVRLESGDELYVAQLMGGRLPEGATALPDGYSIKFIRVTIRS